MADCSAVFSVIVCWVELSDQLLGMVSNKKARQSSAAYLFLVFVVRHDGRLGDVNPIVVFAINAAAILGLVRVSPGREN